jgi:1-deoxy-D-xylulose-5-phosphate synthase
MDPEIKAIPLGESELLRDGGDVVIVAVGSMVHPALEAAAELVSQGISAAVLNARFVKPLDKARLLPLVERCAAVVTVEEHTVGGGFGGAVLEAISAAGIVVKSRCLGVPDVLIEHGESTATLALDAPGIAAAVVELLREGSKTDGD